MMLNLQDTKQDSMMIEIKTMLEDTKRVDTLKIEDSKLMDRCRTTPENTITAALGLTVPFSTEITRGYDIMRIQC